MLTEIDRQRVLSVGFQAVLAGESNVVLRTTGASESVLDFARSVGEGLGRRPRTLDCRFLYDARGSELYEGITAQPEYYPTRTEAAILARCARRLRALTGPVNLLELGSGSSVKTDHLLAAWLAKDPAVFYIPVDISESALLQANQTISTRHPGVRVIGLNTTYEQAFRLLPDTSPVMVIFLGSSIGNFDEAEADLFLRRVAAGLTPDDFFLLGLDLVKEPSVLEAAYNDAAGLTAAFTRNLFVRMNRELGAGLDPASIEHLARWRPERRRVEIHARFRRPQILRVRPLGMQFRLAAGEKVLVEISRKFEAADLPGWLGAAGFDIVEVFTDPRHWFSLLLLRKSRQMRKVT